MNSTLKISNWLAEEQNSGRTFTPDEQLAAAIARLQQIAYAKGLLEGLQRLEMIAAIVPNDLAAQDIIDRAKRAIDEALRKWEESL